MPEEIQSLLDKIQQEGMVKVEQERTRILSEAKAKASQILDDAQKKADDIVKKAKADSELSSQRAVEAIKQSSRDIILSLQNEILERVRKIAKQNIDSAMTVEFMRSIIIEIVKSGKNSEDLKLILPKKQLDEIGERLKASLATDLRSAPAIFADSSMSSGIKIGFKGQDLLLDFSSDALVDMICAYTGPRIAAILKDKPSDK